jgi:transposase
MFAMGAATRIYVVAGATDMRKSFNGLEGLIRERLACDPTSGHIFLFANARRNRLKLVFFEVAGCGSVDAGWRAAPCTGQRRRAGKCS